MKLNAHMSSKKNKAPKVWGSKCWPHSGHKRMQLMSRSSPSVICDFIASFIKALFLLLYKCAGINVAILVVITPFLENYLY